jgi:thiol-disulfide isomerase/thioredoxin
MRPSLLPLLAVFGLLPTLRALDIGDPAPALRTGEWIQGEPVRAFAPDQVYLVEFWATWCGPCIATIPHLNALHQKYQGRGLVVIGQNVWERDTSKVRPFLKKMGEKMTYRVALDDPSEEGGRMANTWLKAAGRNGIPSAFLVGKDGKLAWIGHPGELDEPLIEAVLEGRFDPKQAAAEREKREAGLREGRALFERFVRAMAAEDFAAALQATRDMEASPDSRLAEAALNFRLVVYGRQEAWDDFHATVRAAAERVADDADSLNNLAWQVVTEEKLVRPDLDLAQRLADRAVEMTEGKNAAYLDTQARVVFRRGEHARAIALEEKALALSDAKERPIFLATLDYYRRGELPTVKQLTEAAERLRRAQDDGLGEDI